MKVINKTRYTAFIITVSIILLGATHHASKWLVSLARAERGRFAIGGEWLATGLLVLITAKIIYILISKIDWNTNREDQS